MKDFHHISLLFFTIFLAVSTSLNAQLYEVPIEERIRQSSVIIEGEVVLSTAFSDAKGKIYTANKIVINNCIKGDCRNQDVTIITKGGSIGERVSIWENFLQLSKGEKGLFF